MDAVNNDRRVRKTKRALHEALINLMSEKDIRSISVKSLTEKADIHRSTFYAHYVDIFDLYDDLEDTVMFELEHLITENFSLKLHDYFRVLFNYIDENKNLCRLLFTGEHASCFLARLTDLFKAACLENWSGFMGERGRHEALAYYAEYHLNGGFAMVRRWVDSDFKYPKEEMVRMIAGLDAHISKYLAEEQQTETLK
ncbi:TetR/AcrR family transcriptional regulator [Corticicoccus populi]|uniref:TetR/AcrR family transcriptional regulator n=1 Tax=Corticicoccus populi TaxID=1812821 RepID=A0ABW5WW28_9STAP